MLMEFCGEINLILKVLDNFVFPFEISNRAHTLIISNKHKVYNIVYNQQEANKSLKKFMYIVNSSSQNEIRNYDKQDKPARIRYETISY